jgi:DNA-binding IclR family transcriptional regulator
MRLTGAFEDSVVLSIPSGVESLCIDVEEGSYPIRANYLTVGSRRPLGVGSGSLALLAWMPEAEREAALEILASQLTRYPRITPAFLDERIAQAREQGYVVLLDVVVERMGGIAMPILDAEGRPVGAISIAALNERILSRETALATALKREATVCQVLWAQATRPTGLTSVKKAVYKKRAEVLV